MLIFSPLNLSSFVSLDPGGLPEVTLGNHSYLAAGDQSSPSKLFLFTGSLKEKYVLVNVICN